MAMGSTQPLTEMSTRNLLGVKGGLRARKADNLTAFCEPIVEKMWEPRRLTTLWAPTACYKVRALWSFARVRTVVLLLLYIAVARQHKDVYNTAVSTRNVGNTITFNVHAFGGCNCSPRNISGNFRDCTGTFYSLL
jgi:hypothetical protein